MCRGPAADTYALCYRCNQHRASSGGRVADTVVPIAYAIKGEQHYQNLIAYKATNPAAGSQSRLRDLTLLFLHDHWRCLESAVGGRLTELAIVPSTRGRLGQHPLVSLLASRIPLPLVTATSNPGYPAEDRDFHKDRFQVTLPPRGGATPRRALLLDDTWTTGGRLQSMAYTLKTAGTTSVLTVVIGRLVKHEYQPSRELLRRVANIPFDLARCGLPSCRRATE